MGTTPAKPKVIVRNLNFYYGETAALRNINVEIPEYRVTAFIGPSGCGKSTLLRTFNQIYKLYPNQRATGEILLDGVDILRTERFNRLRARVGMVFQHLRPFPCPSMTTSLSASGSMRV